MTLEVGAVVAALMPVSLAWLACKRLTCSESGC